MCCGPRKTIMGVAVVFWVASSVASLWRLFRFSDETLSDSSNLRRIEQVGSSEAAYCLSRGTNMQGVLLMFGDGSDHKYLVFTFSTPLWCCIFVVVETQSGGLIASRRYLADQKQEWKLLLATIPRFFLPHVQTRVSELHQMQLLVLECFPPGAACHSQRKNVRCKKEPILNFPVENQFIFHLFASCWVCPEIVKCCKLGCPQIQCKGMCAKKQWHFKVSFLKFGCTIELCTVRTILFLENFWIEKLMYQISNEKIRGCFVVRWASVVIVWFSFWVKRGVVFESPWDPRTCTAQVVQSITGCPTTVWRKSAKLLLLQISCDISL